MKFQDIPQFTSDGNYQVNYPIHRFIKYVDEEVEMMGLQLNPDFQRGHVWTEEQQISWLEYFMRGGKSGTTIYFNNPGWNKYSINDDGYRDYVCVDGLQRITAMKRFINNEIPVFGCFCNDFEDDFRFIKNMITLNVNNLKSKEEVLQWYLDMNSGGTPHSKEEIDRVRGLLDVERNKSIDESDMDF